MSGALQVWVWAVTLCWASWWLEITVSVALELWTERVNLYWMGNQGVEDHHLHRKVTGTSVDSTCLVDLGHNGLGTGWLSFSESDSDAIQFGTLIIV